MTRNASATARKKKATTPAEERYAREPLHKRVICYNFWSFIVTDGKEGDLWNPNKTPGSVYNYRSSEYIRRHIKQVSFCNTAKVTSC